MAGTSTTNLGLYKPDPTENYDVITDLNDNLQKIDTAVGDPSSASGVTGTGAFEKIGALNTKLSYMVELGLVSDINVANRAVHKVYHMEFDINTQNNPFGSADGHAYLYIGSNSKYGRIVAYSDAGIKTAALNNGAYDTFVTIA